MELRAQRPHVLDLREQEEVVLLAQLHAVHEEHAVQHVDRFGQQRTQVHVLYRRENY